MKDVGNYLQGLGVTVRALEPSDAQAFDQRWLEAFASRVRSRHGCWVYLDYRWHGFSYGLQPCTEGPRALSDYQAQRSAPYIVFDEDLSECLACESTRYPDLSSLGGDLYVTHANLQWTMVFTHEQPEIGPFFAVRHDD